MKSRLKENDIYKINMLNKAVYKINEFINLEKNIAIFGDIGTGKTTLLKKIIGEIFENDKNRKLFIIAENKSEFKNEFKENMSKNANITVFSDIKEATDTLKEIYKQDYIDDKITIIIDNLNYNINEEDEILIKNILRTGRMKRVNLVATIMSNIKLSPNFPDDEITLINNIISSTKLSPDIIHNFFSRVWSVNLILKEKDIIQII